MAAVYKALSKSVSKQDEPSSNGIRKNKQRVLILSSRGITHRHRHLLNDMAAMMPHGRRENKFDSKSKLYQLNELAELYNCNNVLFFEARKGKDLYAWISKVPNGPTVKLHLQNLHTMEELHFTGNCLKGSRPVLSFDSAFDRQPHLQLMRQLFLHVFGVPQAARRSKPFTDHVMSFSIVDGKIWLRNYQISEVEAGAAQAGGEGQPGGEPADPRNKKKGPPGKDTEISLVEIGPRFVMTPIIIQEGSFGGPIIYQNKEFVSPNQIRADLRKQRAAKRNSRAEQYVGRLAKKGDLGLRSEGGRRAPKDDLDVKMLFS